MAAELEELMKGDRRKKWTYSELLERYKSLFTKTCDVYIPELFEALKREKQESGEKWTNQDLEDKIVKDLDGINKPSTIHAHRPDWMKDPRFVKSVTSGHKTRTSHKNSEVSRQKAIETFERASNAVDDPSTDEPDILSGQPLEQWEESHPEIAKTSFQKVGEINKSVDKLWKALTGLSYMPHAQDDVMVEHIKSTRQFRKDIVREMQNETELTYLHNWLVWVKMATDDMLKILDGT